MPHVPLLCPHLLLQLQGGCQPITDGVEATELLPLVEQCFWRRGAEEHVELGRHCKGKWQPQERQVEGTVMETRLEAHTSRGEDAGAWHCAHTC